MTNRERGDYLERQTKAALRALGWWVIRAAGSLGEADLVALRAGRTPLLVSCKINGRIGPNERDALAEAADRAGARAVVAARPTRGRVALWYLRDDALIWLDEIPVPPKKKARAD